MLKYILPLVFLLVSVVYVRYELASASEIRARYEKQLDMMVEMQNTDADMYALNLMSLTMRMQEQGCK